VDAGAVAKVQGAMGRPTAAAQLRRPRYDDAEHSDENERHLRVPHLAAKLRATFMATEERQSSGSQAAVLLGFAWRRRALELPKVWRKERRDARRRVL
jgi:hypothetical protein